LFEYRAGLEAMVLQNGHRLAISLASRNFSPAGQLSEQWGGIHQLRTIKALSEGIDESALTALSATLASIGRELFLEGNMQMALIGDEKALDAAGKRAAEIAEGLGPAGDRRRKRLPADHAAGLTREGWQTASAVSYVASVFPAVRMIHADAPVLSVTAKLLRSLYLHREIREKGGAYGGFALYNSEEGLFGFGSYRDPHIQATLKVYRNAAEYIKNGKYSQEDVKEAILQVCSEIDKPDPPGAAARKAFYRRMVGLSDEARRGYKTKLLAVTRKDVVSAAEKYFADSDIKSAVAVISGEEKLSRANEKLGDAKLELFKI